MVIPSTVPRSSITLSEPAERSSIVGRPPFGLILYAISAMKKFSMVAGITSPELAPMRKSHCSQ